MIRFQSLESLIEEKNLNSDTVENYFNNFKDDFINSIKQDLLTYETRKRYISEKLNVSVVLVDGELVFTNEIEESSTMRRYSNVNGVNGLLDTFEERNVFLRSKALYLLNNEKEILDAVILRVTEIDSKKKETLYAEKLLTIIKDNNVKSDI